MNRFGMTRNEITAMVLVTVLTLIAISAVYYHVTTEEVQDKDYERLAKIIVNPETPESVKYLVRNSMEDGVVTNVEYNRISKAFRQTWQGEEESRHDKAVKNLRKLLDEQTTS